MLTIPGSVLAVLLGPEIIHLLLGGGAKWDDVIVPFQIFSAGLLFRTSYKISDSLARAMGTVYQRALRQAVYAVAVVVGAFIGTQYDSLNWVAVGVTGAIILNYLLMAQLSLKTAPITWGQFFYRQGRGLRARGRHRRGRRARGVRAPIGRCGQPGDDHGRHPGGVRGAGDLLSRPAGVRARPGRAVAVGRRAGQAGGPRTRLVEVSA